MAKIKFIFEDKSIAPIEVENIKSGQSILEITESNNIALNDNCGGVCACSTCHIYILEGFDNLEKASDTEEDMIDRANNPTLDSRLACQSKILSDDDIFLVKIPDQRDIIGHEH